jgi:transposase
MCDNEHMRPFGTSEQLARRRQRALELLQHGQGPTEVASLKRGGYVYGSAEDYWTLDRIAHLIWNLFHVRYRASSVWYLLRRLGWSCQKPQRRSLARDDAAIAHWKRYLWPQVKKVG